MNGSQSADKLVAEAHRLHLAGRLADAEAGYRKALAVSGRNADALRFLGALLLQRNDAKGAIPLLEKAVKLQPGAALWVNLAAAYRADHDPGRAIMYCRRAIALDKTIPAAFFNLGHACRDLAKLPEAAEAYREFLKLAPGDVEGHVVLGDTLRLMSNPEAAMEAYQAALVYDPAHVKAHVNVAGIIASRGFFRSALTILEALVRVAPASAEARKTLSVAQLQLGDFAEGWKGFEARFESDTERVPRQPAPPPYWRGEDLAGKSITVWSEQGLGEEILFASQIPDLLARAEKCGIQCSSRMAPVFRRSFPGVEVAAHEQAAAHRARFDFQQSLVSLGQYLRPDFASFPRDRGYLKADPGKTAHLREKYAALARGRRIIGLSWRSTNPAFGAAKSASLDHLAAALARTDALFVNLQYGDCAADLARVRERLGIDIVADSDVDSAVSMDDFMAQVAAMDLVISTSNTTAHAAGALDIPVWILLPFAAGAIWYWFLGREDSPWYPSATLIRASRHD
ncbi:MAG: tetratricopeptide repeat protein, partial [Rhodospirillaceae bacterium]